MKNQNDLIVAGAVVLVCIGVSITFMMTKRTPSPPPPVPKIVTTEAQPPQTGVTYAPALPGGSGAPGGGRRGGLRGGPGGGAGLGT